MLDPERADAIRRSTGRQTGGSRMLLEVGRSVGIELRRPGARGQSGGTHLAGRSLHCRNRARRRHGLLTGNLQRRGAGRAGHP